MTKSHFLREEWFGIPHEILNILDKKGSYAITQFIY